jgi:pimeloyl-ACP methyl ester carboxylesterase
MASIFHVVAGEGTPPLVFVHGYACSHTDWRKQVAHFSPRHKTVAVDLPGHGASKARPEDCTIENCGQSVADLMRVLKLPPAVIFGHSMGCRVALEAAQRAPEHAKAIVLVDGSNFNPAMEPVMKARFAAGEAKAIAAGMFEQMFTPRSASEDRKAIIDRATGQSPEFLEHMMLSLIGYDLRKLDDTLARVTKPLLAIQATFTNERRERSSMVKGQNTPYFDLLRSKVPGVQIEIVPNAGHFPQLDAAEETNAMIETFVRSLPK